MNFHPALLALLNPVTANLLVRHLAGALISGIWEGVLLAAAIGLCLQLVPKITARLRFVVWTITFAVLAALPLLNVIFAVCTKADQHLSSGPHLQLDPHWSYALAALWLAAAIGRFGHLAIQAVQLRALWHSGVPVSMDLLPELSLGGVELCISTEIDRPGVIGFLSPRILIPAWLFDQLTPGEVEQIVLHELEHLRRRDDWVNLFQKMGLVLFPLSPALFWIDRRLAAEREFACDDGVLGRTHAPRAYATCLTRLVERRLAHRRNNRFTMLALGAVDAVRRSEFSRRIESILGFGRRSALRPGLARILAACLVAGVLGGAVSLARAPQFVSFNKAALSQAASSSAQTAPVLEMNVGANRQTPMARLEEAVFHPAQAAVAVKPTTLRVLKPRSKSRPHVVASTTQVDAVYSEAVPRSQRQLTVLTTWHPGGPQPVLVTLPDGRTFLATYAADPNRAGWFIIQL